MTTLATAFAAAKRKRTAKVKPAYRVNVGAAGSFTSVRHTASKANVYRVGDLPRGRVYPALGSIEASALTDLLNTLDSQLAELAQFRASCADALLPAEIRKALGAGAPHTVLPRARHLAQSLAVILSANDTVHPSPEGIPETTRYLASDRQVLPGNRALTRKTKRQFAHTQFRDKRG